MLRPANFTNVKFLRHRTDWAEPECTNTAGSRVDTYAFWWIVSSVGPLFLIFPFVLRAQHFSARINGVAKFIRARGSRRFVEMDANSKSEDESDGSGGDEDDDDDEGDGGFSRI